MTPISHSLARFHWFYSIQKYTCSSRNLFYEERRNGEPVYKHKLDVFFCVPCKALCGVQMQMFWRTICRNINTASQFGNGRDSLNRATSLEVKSHSEYNTIQSFPFQKSEASMLKWIRWPWKSLSVTLFDFHLRKYCWKAMCTTGSSSV